MDFLPPGAVEIAQSEIKLRASLSLGCFCSHDFNGVRRMTKGGGEAERAYCGDTQ